LWVALALFSELHNEVRNRGSRFKLVERVLVALKCGPRFVQDAIK
jgi:hypothetical protein